LDGFITDPLNPDTDGDGFRDGDERFSDPTDPNSKPGLERDLIAYFPLDGNVLDENPNNPGAHNGIFQGSAPASYIPAKLGDGLNLDGVNQFVTIGGPESDVEFVGRSMSVSAWFSIPSFSRTWQCLVGKGEGHSWRIHREGDQGHMTFTGGNDDIQGADFASLPQVANGQMHHLVAIAEHGVSSRIWIDGVLAGTRASPAPNLVSQNDNPARIGDNAGATGRYWRGRVDDLAIWGRVLEPGEIRALWNDGNGRSVKDLVSPPSAGPVLLTDLWFEGPALKVSAEGLQAAKSYTLRRSLNGQAFTAVGSTFTGGASHTFTDPSPPIGEALYQIWTTN
jgi:hypothetical protein